MKKMHWRGREREKQNTTHIMNAVPSIIKSSYYEEENFIVMPEVEN